ncbi:MAG: hypothetical protein WC303_03070 [Candidatus Paceibacterota bacterium]|jgi:hypothetical protein
MNYKGKKYKKISMWWSNKPVKKGDLIVLHCRQGSDYLKYNGVYEVVSDYKEIHNKNYKGDGITLCLKLGYNVGGRDYSKLVEIKNRKKNLPMPLKEENVY